MSKPNLAEWLTLTANIGILIGLFLVIIEIRQNTDFVRLQFVNDNLLAVAQAEIPMQGENPAEVMMKAMYSPDELTYADFRVVDAYLVAKMDLLVRQYRLGQEGILDEMAWKTAASSFEWHFGNKFGRLWWEHEGRREYAGIPELVAYVDDKVSRLSMDGTTASWSKIQSELTKEIAK